MDTGFRCLGQRNSLVQSHPPSHLMTFKCSAIWVVLTIVASSLNGEYCKSPPIAVNSRQWSATATPVVSVMVRISARKKYSRSSPCSLRFDGLHCSAVSGGDFIEVHSLAYPLPRNLRIGLTDPNSGRPLAGRIPDGQSHRRCVDLRRRGGGRRRHAHVNLQKAREARRFDRAENLSRPPVNASRNRLYGLR